MTMSVVRAPAGISLSGFASAPGNNKIGGASGAPSARESSAESANSTPTSRSEFVRPSSASRAVPMGTERSRGCCRMTMRVRVAIGAM
jgi:hypothetical protein